MKKEYAKPFVQWVPMRSNEAVAEVCWAYANNSKEFYHDIPGYGYAILTIQKSNGCSNDATFVTEYSNPNMTSEQRAEAEIYIQEVIARAKAEAGNKASNYKGNKIFSETIDPSWS